MLVLQKAERSGGASYAAHRVPVRASAHRRISNPSFSGPFEPIDE
jgi:hypothetical protein